MRTLCLFAATPLLLGACAQQQAAPTASAEIRTIENTPISSIPVQPTPSLDDIVVPTQTAADDDRPPNTPRTTTATDTTGTAVDEELSRKMNLPFAPAIAMDPVDGSKVSITPDTPIVEYKNRLYYFSSVKNRQIFVANPEDQLKARRAAY